MFDTLLASPTTGAPWTRAVIAALLLHVLLIVAAVGSTASPNGGTPPIARDTVRLEITDVSALGPQSPETRRPRPEADIPEAPSVPDIPVDAPELRLPRLSFTTVGPPESSVAQLHRKFEESGVPVDSSPSVFGTVEVDELPELLDELHPRYPRELQRAGVSGLVQVQYVVEGNGRMNERSVRVLGSTHPAFLLSALQALRDTRFKPARRGGRPVAVLVQQTFRFGYR
jgi:protein TonB